MKATTRTFKSGNSIAVRIPHQFNIEAGKTLEIKRRGKELVLVEAEETLAGLIDAFNAYPADFFAEGRHDSPPEATPELALLSTPVKSATKKTGAKSRG